MTVAASRRAGGQGIGGEGQIDRTIIAGKARRRFRDRAPGLAAVIAPKRNHKLRLGISRPA